jgi:hypothetical protein
MQSFTVPTPIAFTEIVCKNCKESLALFDPGPASLGPEWLDDAWDEAVCVTGPMAPDASQVHDPAFEYTPHQPTIAFYYGSWVNGAAVIGEEVK